MAVGGPCKSPPPTCTAAAMQVMDLCNRNADDLIRAQAAAVQDLIVRSSDFFWGCCKKILQNEGTIPVLW